MRKRLVVCCDGTWNNPESETHIHWIYKACRDRDGADGCAQEAFYFKGVGTEPKERIPGGAVGAGLSRNVRDAYRWVQERHEPGDELFVFGFSRGAYTARSLAGFLGLVGRLKRPEDIDPAYFWYRLRGCCGKAPSRERRSWLERSVGGALDRAVDRIANEVGERIRPRVERPVPVTFLGVFDTVGALGVPFQAEELAAEIDGEDLLGRLGIGRALSTLGNWADVVRRPIEGFHNTELGGHVAHGYHALAIDERRRPFLPSLWSTTPAGTKVEQAWFAGVHGDVGGSYYKGGGQGGLSAIPLAWMLEKAAALGLGLDPAGSAARQADPESALAPQHDSSTRLHAVVGRLPVQAPMPRPIGNTARARLNAEQGFELELVRTPEFIHPSVGRRWSKEVREIPREEAKPTRTIRYTPPNLPLDAGQLAALQGGDAVAVV
jgi:uncharacterized protein (DUF2235 family)